MRVKVQINEDVKVIDQKILEKNEILRLCWLILLPNLPLNNTKLFCYVNKSMNWWIFQIFLDF